MKNDQYTVGVAVSESVFKCCRTSVPVVLTIETNGESRIICYVDEDPTTRVVSFLSKLTFSRGYSDLEYASCLICCSLLVAINLINLHNTSSFIEKMTKGNKLSMPVSRYTQGKVGQYGTRGPQVSSKKGSDLVGKSKRRRSSKSDEDEFTFVKAAVSKAGRTTQNSLDSNFYAGDFTSLGTRRSMRNTTKNKGYGLNEVIDLDEYPILQPKPKRPDDHQGEYVLRFR